MSLLEEELLELGLELGGGCFQSRGQSNAVGTASIPDLPSRPSLQAQSNEGLRFLRCPPLVGLFLLLNPPAPPGIAPRRAHPRLGLVLCVPLFSPPGRAGDKAACDREPGSDANILVTLVLIDLLRSLAVLSGGNSTLCWSKPRKGHHGRSRPRMLPSGTAGSRCPRMSSGICLHFFSSVFLCEPFTLMLVKMNPRSSTPHGKASVSPTVPGKAAGFTLISLATSTSCPTSPVMDRDSSSLSHCHSRAPS